MLDITTETKGLEQTLSAIVLLSSSEWITATLKANKQAFSDLESDHYNKVSKTTRTTKRTGEFGIDTGALYQDMTNNILVDGTSLSIGSNLSYGSDLENLLSSKYAKGQAQESSLLPSDEEFYALLEQVLPDAAESIWSGN